MLAHKILCTECQETFDMVFLDETKNIEDNICPWCFNEGTLVCIEKDNKDFDYFDSIDEVDDYGPSD